MDFCLIYRFYQLKILITMYLLTSAATPGGYVGYFSIFLSPFDAHIFEQNTHCVCVNRKGLSNLDHPCTIETKAAVSLFYARLHNLETKSGLCPLKNPFIIPMYVIVIGHEKNPYVSLASEQVSGKTSFVTHFKFLYYTCSRLEKM